MPFVRIWIHLIFSTKNSEKLITTKLKPVLIDHLKDNAKQKEIWIDIINCVQDHIHILISLAKDQSIGNVAKLLKGESSFWVNKNKLCIGKFEWQDDYMAFSVSESVIDKVRSYIDNQEEHHKMKSYKEEYDEFMDKIGKKYLG